MDTLSEVLSICRAERAVTAQFTLRAPWALQSTGVPGALIRLSQGAPYWIQLAGQEPVRVEAGDLLMLPTGAAHTLSSAPGLPATPFTQLIAQHADGPKDENPLVFSHGGCGEGTEVFSVLLWFSAYCRHSVFRLLPPLIHLRPAQLPIASCLASTMQSLIVETLNRRPGWRLSAARMGELLLVNILREQLGRPASASASWLRGLGEPSIARAIQCIHQAPANNWTVEELARESGLSRSRFAERFKALVGASPIGYLTEHRMALAAEQLEAGEMPASRIAEHAGYESTRVFARAFQRWAGLTPHAFVQRERERRKALSDWDVPQPQPPRELSG